jgi:hypothetical protein
LGINFTTINITSSACFTIKVTQRSRVKTAKSDERILSYLARKHGEVFRTKELSQSLQSRFIMMIPTGLGGISLISLLGGISTQGASQVSGFAGISRDCASVQLITHSKVAGWNHGWLRVRWTVRIGQKLIGKWTTRISIEENEWRPRLPFQTRLNAVSSGWLK